MNGSKLRILFGTLGVLALLLLVAFYSTGSLSLRHALAMPKLFDRGTPDHLVDRFTTIVDEQGEMLSMMSRTVFIGDQLYTAEGRSYRIGRVEGDQAEAQFLGMDPQIVAYNELYGNQVAPVTTNLAEQKNSAIAIYHSHTDESYVPSDGTESIPFKGGIYQVGKALVDKLQGRGVTVNYDETPHDPHDNNAYVRSRRTAANLMKSNPAAIFDIHRDGVPDPSYYRATVDGKQIAKLRLVVGRENPRMDANMDFAKRMMAAANNMHNQVVKEIFVGKGDYNQDLTPTALLIEAGTHTNTKEEAAMGIALFSEAVPNVLGLAAGTTGNPAAQAPGAGGRPAGAAGGAGRALAWILGITIVGGVGFLLISSGSWENAKKRISGFGREFTSFFGPRPAARKNVKLEEAPGHRKGPEEQDPLANKALKETKDDITKD
ncbi:Stage II sporulation protein P (SpoIIP) [Pelotomaculum sp. FP]|uniref:stage II sporulation protein P n=1 Tax=Pelotomaculum sp. FP TaxID=261474 RepID=UPI0010670CF5|nr:stage II sporulation protein P [Pelotomaculum sp. FP]TEB17372.1 Stage II sporulation protein P (SpoIIP) [Pelotomaculum sp. FP]